MRPVYKQLQLPKPELEKPRPEEKKKEKKTDFKVDFFI